MFALSFTMLALSFGIDQVESCIDALLSLRSLSMNPLEPNEPHSAPTLSAVAKLAGVSSITVSRVVRLPDLVAPETRGRVETAMRELGYVPNQLAGALASARTRSVGVLVPTIANSIFADTVQGLSDELEPLGYAVILAQSRYDAAREDHMLSALLSRRPEAIIMVGSPRSEEHTSELQSRLHLVCRLLLEKKKQNCNL